MIRAAPPIRSSMQNQLVLGGLEPCVTLFLDGRVISFRGLSGFGLAACVMRSRPRATCGAFSGSLGECLLWPIENLVTTGFEFHGKAIGAAAQELVSADVLPSVNPTTRHDRP
jgi:hypothetical protein